MEPDEGEATANTVVYTVPRCPDAEPVPARGTLRKICGLCEILQCRNHEFGNGFRRLQGKPRFVEAVHVPSF